jgi:hypothetical protein
VTEEEVIDDLLYGPQSFFRWIEQNPSPTLIELIERNGSYQNIPDEAWADFDQRMTAWQLAYRERHDSLARLLPLKSSVAT